MLEPQEVSFFMQVAQGARGLSKCSVKQGAVFCKKMEILSYGYNKELIEGHEISAIYDAVLHSFSKNLDGSILFSTYFPSKRDLEIIVAIKCITIYFSGQIFSNDMEAIKFINNLAPNNIPLEIIQLQI